MSGLTKFLSGFLITGVAGASFVGLTTFVAWFITKVDQLFGGAGILFLVFLMVCVVGGLTRLFSTNKDEL